MNSGLKNRLTTPEPFEDEVGGTAPVLLALELGMIVVVTVLRCKVELSGATLISDLQAFISILSPLQHMKRFL
jgi:hypothetical protein